MNIEMLPDLDITDEAAMVNLAFSLSTEDIYRYVQLMKDKHDIKQYHGSLVLQIRSQLSPDVYSYFDDFLSLIRSSNGYHRGIGFMLLARNAKWDKEGKFEKHLEEYLMRLKTSKPIPTRKGISNLKYIACAKPNLKTSIIEWLKEFDTEPIAETMAGLIEKDIQQALFDIQESK